MNKNLVSKAGEIGQDNLIARLTPAAETTGVQLKAGAGKLARGAVLAVNAAGTCELYGGTEGQTVSYVLAEDADASGDAAVTAVAYRSGNFNPAAVSVASGYALTAADLDALRKYGIVFTQML